MTLPYPHNIICYGDYSTLELRSKYGDIIGHTAIDTQDVALILALGKRWYKTYYGYADSTRLGRLHNVILKHDFKSFDAVVDHINRNRLDNRRKNLRIVPQNINIHNSKLRCTNKTGIKGLTWDKSSNSYRLRLRLKNYGRFKTIAEASAFVKRNNL